MRPLSFQILVPVLTALVGCAITVEGEDADLHLVDTEAYMGQEVLVSLDDGEDGVARLLVSESLDLDELEHNTQLGVTRLFIRDDRPVKDVVAALQEDHRVSFAEPNYIAWAHATVNDPYVDYQWNLSQIGAQDAWDYGIGSGVTVAILDTGVRDGGPDGITNLLNGYDFYYNDSDPTDNDGHGTFVASTVGQTTNNGKGLAGIAPGAAILPVKVMSDQGYGDVSAISNGIVWSVDQGADVINMSLGTNYSSRTLEKAVDYAASSGVVMTAATGNEYASYLNYPAAYDSVIAVGASRYDGNRAGYSNYGSGMGLLAPGGDLSKDQDNDGYADGILFETFENGQWTYPFWEGTSMAAPHVAGAAALILAQGDYSPDEVFGILAETATDLGSSGYDRLNGYGLIDIEAAVQLAASGEGNTAPDDPATDEDSDDSSSEDNSDSSTDSTAPVISSPSGYTDGSSFTIQWTTNEQADTYVVFEDYGAFGNPDLTTSHTLRFSAQAGATYYFDIQSTDAAGNTSTDGPYSITL